jgi:hypothetical protein
MYKNMSEEIKHEEPKVEERPVRRIIIETNGDWVGLKQAEVAGDIELVAILQRLTAAIIDKMNGKYQKQ